MVVVDLKSNISEQSSPVIDKEELPLPAKVTINPETLYGIDAFRDLTVAERREVAEHCHCHSYKVGDQILSAQDKGNDVFFIVNGRVQAIIYANSGQQVTLQDLDAGQMFGETSAIDGEPRCASIIAATDALIIAMTADDFNMILWHYPAVGKATLRRLTGMVRHLSEQVFERDALPAKQRVQADLLRRSSKYQDEANMAIISPAPNHGDMAAHIGVRRETVSREIAHLRDIQLVKRLGNDLLICDVTKLSNMIAAG